MAVSYKDVLATEAQEKAQLFNTFFKSVYSANAANVSTPPVVDVVNPHLLCEVKTTRAKVEKVLHSLNPRKATGVDGIPARILKAFARELSKPLPDLFNLSFESGQVQST